MIKYGHSELFFQLRYRSRLDTSSAGVNVQRCQSRKHVSVFPIFPLSETSVCARLADIYLYLSMLNTMLLAPTAACRFWLQAKQSFIALLTYSTTIAPLLLSFVRREYTKHMAVMHKYITLGEKGRKEAKRE